MVSVMCWVCLALHVEIAAAYSGRLKTSLFFWSGKAANSAWAKAASRTEKETLCSASKSNHWNWFFFWGGGVWKCKLELIFVFLNFSSQCSPCLWCKLLFVWFYWLVFRFLWLAGALRTGHLQCLPGKCFILLFLFAFLLSCLTVLVLKARLEKLSFFF